MPNDLNLLIKKLSGMSEGHFFEQSYFYLIRVFYEDTDVGGVVYHANYLKYFERARSSLLNSLGINQQDLIIKKNLKFVVRELNLKIVNSFELNDLILTETRLKDAKNSCISLEQFAWSVKKNFEKDKLKVKSDIQIVMIDKKNKVKKIKDILFHPFFSNKVN